MPVRPVKDATALQSMRNSDFDAYSAYGEVVDNAIDAGANCVNINVRATKPKRGGYRYIKEIGFADNGSGMKPEVAQRCLQLGYSSRYNNRDGIGRFGVGMTLGAINQAKRVEVYSRTSDGDWLWTYLDLEEMAGDAPQIDEIPTPETRGIPEQFRDIAPDGSGTLVVWGKYDRQPASADDVVEEMKKWLGRTYRKYIWNGLSITVNGEEVKVVDPLYATTEMTRFPADPEAEVFEPIELEWPVPDADRPADAPDRSVIEIKMSLLPRELREYQGAGGAKETRKRFIDENEGVSILRNNREVFYGTIPWWPGASFKEIDRWWGCEISFDAVLDRAFTVKNIKRGAVPNTELKKAIKEKIEPTRKRAVERVREYWNQKDLDEERREDDEVKTGHEEAEEVAAKTPTDESEYDKEKDKEEEAQRLADELDSFRSSEEKAAWAAKFAAQPFTIRDETWRGPDFFETHHLGGSDAILYNRSHRFFEELYGIVAELEESHPEGTDQAKSLKALIDLLLISYSKAESKFDRDLEWTTEQFIEMLRNSWGQYLKNYVDTWSKEERE